MARPGPPFEIAEGLEVSVMGMAFGREPVALRLFGDLDPSGVKGAASRCRIVGLWRRSRFKLLVGSPCTLVVRAEVWVHTVKTHKG